MIDDLKEENKQDHKSVVNRIENLEKVVEDLKKFRWQFAAIVSATLIFIGIIPTVKTVFYQQPTSQEVRK